MKIIHFIGSSVALHILCKAINSLDENSLIVVDSEMPKPKEIEYKMKPSFNIVPLSYETKKARKRFSGEEHIHPKLRTRWKRN